MLPRGLSWSPGTSRAGRSHLYVVCMHRPCSRWLGDYMCKAPLAIKLEIDASVYAPHHSALWWAKVRVYSQ